MRRLSLVALGIALALVGCAAETPGPKAAVSRPLPSYEGHGADLFDDVIAAQAVGLEREATLSPVADARLRERTKVGDAVLRVRVETVTAKQEDSGTSYEVDFHPLQTLAGRFPPTEDPFSIQIGRGSPSSGVLKAFEGRLVGKTFVMFVRAFVKPDGDRVLHFHIVSDDKDVLAAVAEARDLAEIN